jgi:hypothetical protein
MLSTQHGQSDHTRMRTFNEAFQEINANTVFQDLEEPSKW